MHAPLDSIRCVGDVILKEDLFTTIQESNTSLDIATAIIVNNNLPTGNKRHLRPTIGRGQICSEERGRILGDGQYCARFLGSIRGAKVSRWQRCKCLVLTVDDKSVLSLGAFAVV